MARMDVHLPTQPVNLKTSTIAVTGVPVFREFRVGMKV